MHAQVAGLIGDTELSSISPTKNYGPSPTLAVDSAHSVLLNFDLTDLLPSGVTASQVSRARLILFSNTVTTKGNFNVSEVTGSWTEGTVTHPTKTRAGLRIAGLLLGRGIARLHLYPGDLPGAGVGFDSFEQSWRGASGGELDQLHSGQQGEHLDQPSGDPPGRPYRPGRGDRAGWSRGPAHRTPVEEEKKPDEKGRYLHPELFGHAGQPSIGTPGFQQPQPQ